MPATPWKNEVGAPLTSFVEAARGLDMDCAHVDDRPLLVWRCYRTIDGRLRISAEATSADHSRVATITIVGSNLRNPGTPMDPEPRVVEFAETLLPASYAGSAANEAYKWLTNPDSSAEEFEPLRVSFMGNEDVRNLTVYIGDAELGNVADTFDDFHTADALDWGRSAGLSCSIDEAVEAPGEPYQLLCHTETGPRIAVVFTLDLIAPGDYSDTDIAFADARFVPEENSGPLLADIVGSLVTRISNKTEDGTRARDWVNRYAGTDANIEAGVLNAELSVDPNNFFGPVASVKIYPAAYPDR